MRSRGVWGKGLGVGECEVARTYTNLLLHIYYYISITQIYYISTTYLLHISTITNLLHIYHKSPTNLPHIYCISIIQNTQKHTYTPLYMHIPLHICKSIIPFPSMRKPYPTYTYTFVALYAYLQVVPGCFFLI